MTPALKEKAQSLQRAVQYGLANGKKNMIADLDVLDAVFKELDEWRPLTTEEAQAAYDAAEAVPMSKEEIDRIIAVATDPAERLPNSDQALLVAEIRRLRAKIDRLEHPDDYP